MSAKPVLVILRCGDKSLHRDWCSADQSWDLAASYFGDDAALAFPEATYVHRYKGGKWDGIFDFCRNHPEVMDKYDYFWFPDDDIAADPQSLERLFKIVADNRFELSQPSLKVGSYVSHLITLHNCLFQFRNVNFVELMVPLVSRNVFQKILPLFQKARSGFGIDFVWNQFTSDPSRSVAIIDAVQVEHTRPVGGALHKMIKASGVASPQQEQKAFLAAYGHVHKVLINMGGLLNDGRTMTTQLETTLMATKGWLLRPNGNHGFTKKLPALKFIVWVLRNAVVSMCFSPRLDVIAPK